MGGIGRRILDRLGAEAHARALAAAGPDEVLRHGPANRQVGWDAVGGWLAPTPDELVFAPHNFNVRRGVLRLARADVRSARPCWAWLFGLVPVVPNGVLVETWAGEEHRFVVRGRREWAAAIRGAPERDGPRA